MIGKIIDRRSDGLSSFKALINYIAFGIKGGKIVEKVQSCGVRNLDELETASLHMEAAAVQNSRCKYPALHFMISWREHETPTDVQIEEAVRLSLAELGLEECQAVWGLHKDTENLHVHVAANRVHPDTYKAIDPAHGWTKNALEKACRKLELLQGWDFETSGKFGLENGAIVLTPDAQRRAQQKEARVGQTARDFEARNGLKSAERIAIEIAAPIILRSASWSDLHQHLASEGIRYERKGSGAVLIIGDQPVKASTADRKATLARLIQRLGEFQPAAAELITRERAQEPLGPRPDLGQIYGLSRAKYQKTKAGLLNAQRSEFRQLVARQKEERAQLRRKRGYLTHAERSLYAAKQASEKAAMRESHRATRKTRFPTLREAIKFGATPAAGSAIIDEIRYQGAIATMHGPGGVPVLADIRGFTGQATRRCVVYRSAQMAHRGAFIDYGHKIHVPKADEASTVLAALQLAAQKWGGQIELGGPQGYKELTVRLAIAHGIRITNEELQPFITAEKTRLEVLIKRNASSTPTSKSQAAPSSYLPYDP